MPNKKTYDEGVDVIRAIHQTNEKFLVVVTTESRRSSPSEVLEGESSSLDEAKASLILLCRKDDFI